MSRDHVVDHRAQFARAERDDVTGYRRSTLTRTVLDKLNPQRSRQHAGEGASLRHGPRSRLHARWTKARAVDADRGASELDDVRRTEVDGVRVTWRLIEHHLIAILAVNSCDASPVASFGPDHYPDLAQARELLPELAKLWDAVRHEFWAKLIPPHPRLSSGWQPA
ncbi:hypothetical protein AB0B25_23090 [Nocardia sp. NPDC049190]|uniref:hypothetical protein n=1 Tax=Nocardia sp. NPDC049190 TaxID=3155650 RepID=UPI00340369FE